VLHRTVSLLEFGGAQRHVLRLFPRTTGCRRCIRAVKVSVRHERDFDDVFGNRARVLLETPFTSGDEARSDVGLLDIGRSTSVRGRSSLPLVWMPWQRQSQPFCSRPSCRRASWRADGVRDELRPANDYELLDTCST